MYWSCDICDKVIYEQFRIIHLQPGYHKRLANSTIRKYIISKPDGVGQTIAKHLRSHFRNYEKKFVNFVVKLLTPSNQIKNKRRHFTCHPSQKCISDESYFLCKIRRHYSQILELGKTFASLIENITFRPYLTKPKSMLERKLFSMLDKIRENVLSFNYKRYTSFISRIL